MGDRPVKRVVEEESTRHKRVKVISILQTNEAETLLISNNQHKIKGNGYTFREDNSVKMFCLSSEKGSTLKEKNLLPRGANSFLSE